MSATIKQDESVPNIIAVHYGERHKNIINLLCYYGVQLGQGSVKLWDEYGSAEQCVGSDDAAKHLYSLCVKGMKLCYGDAIYEMNSTSGRLALNISKFKSIETTEDNIVLHHHSGHLTLSGNTGVTADVFHRVCVGKLYRYYRDSGVGKMYKS